MFGKRRLDNPRLDNPRLDNPRLDNRGTITIFAAVMFTLLVGFAGLATEYGSAVLAREDTQRVADLAAYGGALAYSSVQTNAALTAAVDRVATLNGVATSAVTPSLVTSPSGDGNQAVQVSVTTDVPLTLSRVFGAPSQLSVTASSYAEIKSTGGGGSPCVVALDTSGTGVTLSGGTALSAPACAVDSNYTVIVPCGTSITTILLSYDSSSAPSQPCSGIQAPTGKTLTTTKNLTSDPLSSNAGVIAASNHISTVAAMTAPSAPTVTSSSNNINFAYTTSGSQSPGTLASSMGCSASVAGGNTWTFTCSGNGPFNFGSITTGGGITVKFNTTGSSSATYNFSGSIYNTGTAMTFGPGTYNIAQGIQTGGGTTTTFGAGTYKIGPSPSSNCSAGNYSICNTGASLTFAGPSTFVLSNGIYNAGGETLALGTGSSANSYSLGKNTTGSPAGNAIYVGGGSNTTFGDAKGGLFQLAGMLNIASGGGSCMTLPAASAHDINGNFSTTGGTILGAGIYTVNGYVALGAYGGGDVSCSGSTVGISGSGVTFAISATSTLSSGTCAGTAFCVASGYNHVTLISPTSGNTEDLIVIGPNANNNATSTAGATFAEGATNTSLSGAFYNPSGAFSLSGGATVGNGSGQCLEVVASEVTLTGGTALASSCVGLGGVSVTPTSIVLVQ
jgi:hypothetical protein